MNYKVTFRKLARDEKIPVNAFHSIDHGRTMRPIVNPETAGQTPNDFSVLREFFVITELDRIESNE